MFLTLLLLAEGNDLPRLGFVGVGESESYQPSFGLLDKQAVKLGNSWGQSFRHDSANPTYIVNSFSVAMFRDAAATPGQTITISIANNFV